VGVGEKPPTRKVPTDPGFFLPHRPRALSCSGASSIFEAVGLAGGQKRERQQVTADAVPLRNHGTKFYLDVPGI